MSEETVLDYRGGNMCEWINTKVRTSDNMVDVLGLIPMGEPNEWVMRVVCYDDETNSWWCDGHKVKVDYWTVLPPKPVEIRQMIK